MTTDKRPWYEELFESGDYVRFWLGGEDAPRIPPERTEKEVAFVVEALGLPGGAHILDLCCGHGRHSIALAGRGYRVTGLDLSPLHLGMARKAGAAAGVTVEWVNADMRDIPSELAGSVYAVINMFTAFGYLESDAEDQKVIDGIERTLRPGGRLFLDFINRESVMRRYQSNRWEEIDGTLVLHESSLDFMAGRNSERLRIIEADCSRHETGLAVR